MFIEILFVITQSRIMATTHHQFKKFVIYAYNDKLLKSKIKELSEYTK